MICGFRSVLCVSVFQGSLLVIVVMIDGSEKTYLLRRFLNFRVHVFLKSAVRIVECAYGNKIRGVELSKKKRKNVCGQATKTRYFYFTVKSRWVLILANYLYTIVY